MARRSTTIFPFLAAHGEPQQYIAIRNDITDRRRLEQEIINISEQDLHGGIC